MIRKFVADLSRIERLVPFHVSRRISERDVIHFFVDDTRLRPLMREPMLYKRSFVKAFGVITPDFSMYLDDEIENWRKAHEWNIRYGEAWQALGVRVIPSVNWATEKSFEFCFDGIEPGGVVAISTQGIDDWGVFEAGFERMKKKLNPSGIICYGTLVCLRASCDVYYFPTFADEMRERINGR